MKATNTTKKPAATKAVSSVNERAVKHLAGNIFRQLQDEGCQPKDIICVSSQLIDLVTTELQKLSNEASA